MAASKWPKSSFQYPERWSQHADILQDDFDALHTYLESNEDKHVPKYLFNILHASYSSLSGKLAWVKTEGDHAKKGGSVVQKGCMKEVVPEAAVKVAAASQDNIEDFSHSEGESDSEDYSDSEGDSDSASESGGDNHETKGVDVDPEASEGTDVSGEELSSDEADSAVDPKALLARSYACTPKTAHRLIIPISNPYLITHVRMMSLRDIHRQCTSAIRSTSAVSDKVSGGAPITKVQQRNDGNVQVFVPNKATLQALNQSDLWRTRFLVDATRTMEINGVLAFVVRSRKTVLDTENKDAHILRVVSETAPRLTALTGPGDIMNMTWLRKNHRGRPSYLLLNFRSPVLANQVIKHGFTWAGVNHKCQRFVQESEMEPCVNCLKYGHQRDRCSAEALCSKCGGKHISSTCSSSRSTCPSCSIQHGIDFKCEKRSTEKRNHRSAILQRRPLGHESGRPGNTQVAKPDNNLRRSQVAPVTNIQGGKVDLRKRTNTGGAHPANERASTAVEEQTASSSSEKTSESDSEHENRGTTGRDHNSARAIAVTTARTDTDASDSENSSDSEDTSETTGFQALMNMRAISSQSNKQTNTSESEKHSKAEPKHGVSHEANQNESIGLLNSVPTTPAEQTHPSVTTKPLESEPEQEVRHHETETQTTIPSNALAVASSKIGASNVDLDSTPSPEDTEAIIRQLDKLKAIVLARAQVHIGSKHQSTGEKRKASEPLSAVSENSRSLTAKRLKHDMPA